MKLHCLLLLAVAALASITACLGNLDPAVAGGGSIEVPNGITATVVRADGSPAAGAIVRLRRNDYISKPDGLAKSAVSSADTLTDLKGRFTINGIDSGAYRIEVNDPSTGPGRGGAVLFNCSIHGHDSINLGSDTLRPYATISGTIDSLKGPAYVQIYGLERIVQVDSSGHFTITDLPQGALDLRVALIDSSKTPVVIKNVQVISGATTPVQVSSMAWRYMQRLILNTTPAGADVAENVLGFPLLVRLRAPAFDFSQAQDSGRDLRFTKADGTLLPYEIEQWDRATGSAAVWVHIDTVYGDSSTQTITMQWGNPVAISQSSGAAVFDTANGFSGVWHLGEKGTGAPGEFHDATANGNNGTGRGARQPAPSPIKGIVGSAHYFDSSYIEIPADMTLEPPGDMSIQAWVRLDSVPLSGNRDFFIVDKYDQGGDWDSYYFRVFAAFNTAQLVWSNGASTTGDAISDSPLLANSWYHLTAVKSDSLITIYVNGLKNSTYRRTIQGTMYQSSGPLVLGSRRTIGDRGGAIDEVQLSGVARPDAWIKLSFENQRQESKLVGFGQ